jgi:hypothetical protein
MKVIERARLHELMEKTDVFVNDWKPSVAIRLRRARRGPGGLEGGAP